MKEEILNNLNNPKILEKLYRSNEIDFRKEFNAVFPEIKENNTALIWNERLNFEKEKNTSKRPNELIFVIIAVVIAGFLIKLPEFLSLKETHFYPRNTSFAILPLLTAYFCWIQCLEIKKTLFIGSIFIVSAIYINLLPDNNSDTLLLANIHLPLFLWTVLGFSFVGNKFNDFKKRINFLRYNGDLAIITAVILLAGALLTFITLGLFSMIQVDIETFYFEYIVIWGLVATPIIGTYLIQNNPQLVDKVSPIVAKIFTPIVFTTLVVYLITMIYTKKDPYNDRDFLLIFNLLLIGVMAIILFSIVGNSKKQENKFEIIMLFALSTVTIIINLIALSAIIFRISSWGFTPNRLAVLGSNLLFLINLTMVTFQLLKAMKNTNKINNIEKSIAGFLPVYSLWTVVVTFIFPFVFCFK